MHKIATIFLKEILDSLRDKRTLLILFLAPFTVLTSILPIQMADGKKAESEMNAQSYKVYIDGAQYSKAISEFLKHSEQIDIINNIENPKKALKKEI
jgi:ABC-type Na+ efflux pump permease subunit